MANVGYINKEVAKMYGIPYSELTPEQKKILHEDSVRRANLIKEREEAVLKIISKRLKMRLRWRSLSLYLC